MNRCGSSGDAVGKPIFTAMTVTSVGLALMVPQRRVLPGRDGDFGSAASPGSRELQVSRTHGTAYIVYAASAG